MQLKWHYSSCGWEVSISISSNTLCHDNHNQFHQLCATLRALNVLEIFNQKNAFKLPTFIDASFSHTIVLFDHAKCGDKFEKSLNSIFLSFPFMQSEKNQFYLARIYFSSTWETNAFGNWQKFPLPIFRRSSLCRHISTRSRKRSKTTTTTTKTLMVIGATAAALIFLWAINLDLFMKLKLVSTTTTAAARSKE